MAAQSLSMRWYEQSKLPYQATPRAARPRAGEGTPSSPGHMRRGRQSCSAILVHDDMSWKDES